MIFNVTISTLPRYTIFSFTGDVDVHKISALAAFLHSDPHYAQVPHSVWDFTNAAFQVAPKEAVSLAHMVLSKRMPGITGRAAMITPEFEVYRKSVDLFNTNVAEDGLSIEVFANLKDAVEWLDTEVNLLDDAS